MHKDSVKNKMITFLKSTTRELQNLKKNFLILYTQFRAR